ncbi:MAG: hypothetical protein IJ812_09580 [Schwartzia sp.]|nr:hypothetical protein [Schwartzia sp. (in: firmicutes)]MBR1759597.1 hypothetical protein [Schwartzia sp. (in: firmicutes)]MBR1886645.1 hypothetical protein [Schwartzia sp. (in: firmicutes)]
MHDASKEKTRSRAEIHARYVKTLEQYRKLSQSQNPPRDQRMMLFTEVKLLGWVLGKRDKDVANELR